MVTPVASVTSPQSAILDEHAKQQLAESFASQSAMNECLLGEKVSTEIAVIMYSGNSCLPDIYNILYAQK
jgi:hypothetical protein